MTAAVVVIFFASSQAILAHNAAYYWGFLLVFDGLALAATVRIKSNWIAPGVLLLNMLGIQQWISAHYEVSDRAVVWSCLNGLFVLFLGQSTVRQKLVPAPVDSLNVLASLGTGLGYFALSYYLLADDYPGWMGPFAVILALVYLSSARVASRMAPDAKPLILSFIGISVTLITLAIPIQLEQNWITAAWAAESVILIWIGFATRSVPLRQASLVVLLLSLLRLFLLDALQRTSHYTLIFNNRVFAFVAVITTLYLIAHFYRRNLSDTESWEQPVRSGLILLANGVSVFLLSQESWTYYEDKLRQLLLSVRSEELGIRQFNLLRDHTVNSQLLTLSVLWGVYSIGAVVVGIVRRYRPIRLFGIALFFLAILKVFFSDIWIPQQLYRIISVIGLGCLLLAVAFLYQRFKKLIFES